MTKPLYKPLHSTPCALAARGIPAYRACSPRFPHCGDEQPFARDARAGLLESISEQALP